MTSGREGPGSMDANAWDRSAEVYARVTPEISYYVDTARAISVRISAVHHSRILELGCGSNGLVLHQIIDPTVKNYTCNDQSEEMLRVLSLSCMDQRVMFIAADAADIAKHVRARFDVVVINNAIWMFQLKETLDAILQALAPNGRIFFTIAEWDLAASPSLNSPRRYVELDAALEKQGFPAKIRRGSETKRTMHELLSMIEKSGMRVGSVQECTSRMSNGDWRRFYSIPAILDKSLPQVPGCHRARVIDEAFGPNAEEWADDFRWILVEVKAAGE